ncbi:LysE family translocator [Streptomyces sp. NPDC020801]|uniref:LysE family translocator n=1 Tax=unclassified Streptomyces TaxID=2593676 RepID=UPI0037A17E11
MHSGTLLSFLAVDFLLVCVPGADWAYAIAAGLRERSVTVAVGGLVAGYALHTLLAVAGLAVLVAGSPGLLTALTVAGAGYLVWLGWGVLRRPAAVEAARESLATTAPHVFLRGATISGLNPKGLLLYLSVLPQFLTTRGAHVPVPVQTAALGGLHMACCAAVYLTVGTLAGAVLHARPAAARAVVRTSGAAMLGTGALLLVERLATL